MRVKFYYIKLGLVKSVIRKQIYLQLNRCLFKGLLHCFSTCIEIIGNNWYCFILKNVENHKKKFQKVKKI